MPDGPGALTRRADRCPWPAILYAKAPLVIAGKALAPGDAFLLTVGSSPDGFLRTIESSSDGIDAIGDHWRAC
jgi:hypothetical protein